MLTFQIAVFTFTTGSPITPTGIQKRKYIEIGHFRNASLVIYTASKVKHHLNIFKEKTVKLSKHEFILVTCLKRNKVVTIYSKI